MPPEGARRKKNLQAETQPNPTQPQYPGTTHSTLGTTPSILGTTPSTLGTTHSTLGTTPSTLVLVPRVLGVVPEGQYRTLVRTGCPF